MCSAHAPPYPLVGGGSFALAFILAPDLRLVQSVLDAVNDLLELRGLLQDLPISPILLFETYKIRIIYLKTN